MAVGMIIKINILLLSARCDTTRIFNCNLLYSLYLYNLHRPTTIHVRLHNKHTDTARNRSEKKLIGLQPLLLIVLSMRCPPVRCEVWQPNSWLRSM